MLLNACGECHRQYEVSHLDEGDDFVCECGETLQVKHHKPRSPRHVRCSGCGGNLEAYAKVCSYCRAEVTFEERNLDSVCPECFARMSSGAKFCMDCGIPISPQVTVALVTGDCPRCEQTLRGRQIAEFHITECSGCAGLWIPIQDFNLICTQVGRMMGIGDLLSAPKHGNQELFDTVRKAHKFRYLRCCQCSDFMIPRNFGGKSGILIDVCGRHGVWLDHGELELVTSFIRSNPNATDKPISRDLSNDPISQRHADYRALDIGGHDNTGSFNWSEITVDAVFSFLGTLLR